MDDQRPTDIPSNLRRLIYLNVAYRVLICRHNECRKAVQARAFSEHLRVQHQTPLRDRERVQEYVGTFNWDYDFSTIQLPKDGSRPQPIIPVIDGFQCRTCPFKSGNRKRMKVHGNKEHKHQRVDDDELFKKVRLQSWFQNHRQRYWVVDEGDSRNADVGIREEVSTSRLGLRDDEGVVDASTDAENDEVEEIGAVEPRDEEVTGAVVDEVVEVVVDEGVEAVVDDEEEVFSAFDDSGDEDYRESSEDVVEDSEGSSEAGVDRSDNEEYTESSGEADDDEEEGSSEVEVERGDSGVKSSRVADDDREEVIEIRPVKSRVSNPSRERRAGKRRMQTGFEGSWSAGIGMDGKTMDSDDSTYQDSSPGFRGRGRGRRRATKRQKKMPRFDDSGVVMGSSQDDGVAPPSSPPVLSWIRRSPGRVDDPFPEPPSTVRNDDDDDGDDAPSETRVGPQDGGTARSTLDRLRERLDRWCQTCPACYLARDFGGEMHHMMDCWRRDTVDIIDQTDVIQQHITEFGGFRGREGCPWCGVPRAICQQWYVSTDGRGEGEPGQRCQYIGILVPAVITMLMDGCNEGWAVFGSWMDRDGVMWTKQAEVFEWFRQGVWWEGMEVAQMVRVFYMLVNKNRGVGRA